MERTAQSWPGCLSGLGRTQGCRAGTGGARCTWPRSLETPPFSSSFSPADRRGVPRRATVENKRIHPVLSVEAEYVILIPYLSPYRSPLVENACYQTLKKIKYSNPVPHCSFRTLDSIFSQKGTHSKLFEISFLVFRGIIISFSLENLREHEFERAK